MSKLILIRHGQSLWNLENRFTGWIDVPLTPQGEEEAAEAGKKIEGIPIQVAYTSALRRAQATLAIVMHTAGLEVPVIRDKALNERDYGDLSGLNKDEMVKRHGAEQVHIWRRSYDVKPPNGEALKDTRARTLPFFERAIMGDIKQGKNVLVVAHGNSNRSIVMAIEDLTPEEIVKVELGTGVPYLYEVGNNGKATSKKEL
ncbi:MAG TPA: 2,3-bisphosphoglycerate-dependent phosphoglycerate mutase [Fimbriimonadaceae bacterium]|nr:2,3-bisphosphoglycerate-dependent phosphoglycerate mutase [Fimbriimonadaceae bacterium]